LLGTLEVCGNQSGLGDELAVVAVALSYYGAVVEPAGRTQFAEA